MVMIVENPNPEETIFKGKGPLVFKRGVEGKWTAATEDERKRRESLMSTASSAISR